MSNTYKPQSEANAPATIPQTGGEVRMDFQGTDPWVTCGMKDFDEEVIIWKANKW